VGEDPALDGPEAVVAHLRRLLPDLSLDGAAEWRRFAGLTYAPGDDGRWHPLWDTRIASLLGADLPDLWPLFGALAGVKLMLVHGTRSTILTAPTVARMRAARPDMVVAQVDCGHAPTLSEPACAAALDAFLEAA
jgi:hypothetical protein